MRIIDINWISEEALEASVTISDGYYHCVAFSCPCHHKVDEKLNYPLFLMDSFGFFLEKEESILSIKKHERKSNFYYHDITGRIYVERKIIKVGKILIEFDEEIPRDIKSGSIVSFTASRIDLF